MFHRKQWKLRNRLTETTVLVTAAGLAICSGWQSRRKPVAQCSVIILLPGYLVNLLVEEKKKKEPALGEISKSHQFFSLSRPLVSNCAVTFAPLLKLELSTFTEDALSKNNECFWKEIKSEIVPSLANFWTNIESLLKEWRSTATTKHTKKWRKRKGRKESNLQRYKDKNTTISLHY